MSSCATGVRSGLAKKFDITVDEPMGKNIQITMTDKHSEEIIKIANIYIPPRGSANCKDEEATQHLVKTSAVEVVSEYMNWMPTEHLLKHLMGDDLPPLSRGHRVWRTKPCGRAHHIDDWIPRELRMVPPRCCGEWKTRKGLGHDGDSDVRFVLVQRQIPCGGLRHRQDTGRHRHRPHWDDDAGSAGRTQHRKWRGRSAALPVTAAWRNYIADGMHDKRSERGAFGAVRWWVIRWAPEGEAADRPSHLASAQ